MILIDSVLKKDENYYPQVFLKECKSIEKGKTVIRCSIDNLKFSSDDSDDSDKELNKNKHIGHYSLNRRDGHKKYTRMLATVKNSAVNAVFRIWSIIEILNLCFPNAK